jgi:hypothetical protein
MGTKYSKLVCDEHEAGVRRALHRQQRRLLRGLGRHLGCINVFYHKASGGKYVPCAVLFDLEPGVIGAVTISRRSAGSSAWATS